MKILTKWNSLFQENILSMFNNRELTLESWLNERIRIVEQITKSKKWNMTDWKQLIKNRRNDKLNNSCRSQQGMTFSPDN